MFQELERAYKKPVYDPFEVFQPTKKFLKEVIKQLKDQSYEIIKKKRENREEDYQIFAWPALDQELQRLQKVIKIYHWRLNGGTPGADPHRITEADLVAAKAIPIGNFYNGKLRRSAQRLLGKCPFHPDKTASFVIYPTNTWYCFGCSEGGDAISYVQKANNLKFLEAVRLLLHK